MKTCLLLLLFTCLTVITFAQQQKVDDALLLEYYQTQRFADALDYLKRTYPEPITDLKTISSLAYTSQMAGKLADAEAYYQRIYEKDSTSVALLFSLGNINLRRGNSARALIYYKKILLRDSTNFNVYKQMATMAYNMGDFASNINYLQKANHLNPDDPDVASDLATIYINLKVYPRADTVVTKALAADTANLLLLREKAIIYYRTEKFPPTIALCTKLIAGGDGANDVINMLGVSYFMVKSYQDCITTLEILEKNKTATETSYYYTAMSYKALKDQEKAIFYFDKAIKEAISINVDSYYSEMGDSYDKLHQLKNAVFAYQKSLLYDSKSVITYYVLANLYDSGLKNKTSAIKYYKKYIKTNPPEKQKSYLQYAKKRLTELSH
ncbi:tetratricopeptide repeat protein [Mucilaginibacter sp. McL0603]|uniref:tetratricopeptide repeat protein n=1 Tax=Mucilaginibacter sp. McL0603 TaxID=3415670 RepID=UPI003CFBBB21